MNSNEIYLLSSWQVYTCTGFCASSLQYEIYQKSVLLSYATAAEMYSLSKSPLESVQKQAASSMHK